MGFQEPDSQNEPITEKDLAEATKISQPYLAQLLRYGRFRAFGESLNIAMAILEIPERRFRDYWQQMSDPQKMRSLRCNPRHTETYARKQAEQYAYELRVFANIVKYLEEGKPPIKKPKPFTPPMVEEMMKKKDPVKALAKEGTR